MNIKKVVYRLQKIQMNILKKNGMENMLYGALIIIKYKVIYILILGSI